MESALALALALPQFGLLSHVSSLRVFSLVLTLSMQPMPSCPDPVRWWQMQEFGLLLPWELQLGAYSVGFVFCFSPPLQVMLPSEIPKLPTDSPVRGFPVVWKLLLLHDSLPRTGFCH